MPIHIIAILGAIVGSSDTCLCGQRAPLGCGEQCATRGLWAWENVSENERTSENEIQRSVYVLIQREIERETDTDRELDTDIDSETERCTEREPTNNRKKVCEMERDKSETPG